MNTTRKCEGMNRFFDLYVDSATSLPSFFSLSRKLEDKKVQKEREKDLKDVTSTPLLRAVFYIEVHASKIYTQKLFHLFQEELIKSTDCLGDLIIEDGEVSTYRVADCDGGTRPHTVAFESSEKRAQNVDIPCMHMLRVFNIRGIWEIPPHYIMKRWTVEAKKGTVLDASWTEILDNSQLPQMYRHNELSNLCQAVLDLGSENEEVFEYAKSGILKLVSELVAKLKPRVDMLNPASTHCSVGDGMVGNSRRTIEFRPQQFSSQTSES